jgi:hypothetical protein
VSLSLHECHVCAQEDPTNTRKPRKVVNSRRPLWCATHRRAEDLRQKKAKRAAGVEKTYGISAEDNHELYLLQGGKCWLCRKATGATKSLAVDHDHATGEVRGRLCGPCNQFIGRLRDDPEAAQRLVAYLTGDTPYRRLKAAQGLAQVYGDGNTVVHRIVPGSDGLYALVESDTARVTAPYLTLVRDLSGVWVGTGE